MNAAIVFIDRKPARGGGQVVLEQLLRRLPAGGQYHLIGHPDVSSILDVPHGVTIHSTVRGVVSSVASGRVQVVANATSDFGFTLRAARQISRAVPAQVDTFAILHNYPKDALRSALTRAFLTRFDRTVVVEPGLLRLAPRADVPLGSRRSPIPSLSPCVRSAEWSSVSLDPISSRVWISFPRYSRASIQRVFSAWWRWAMPSMATRTTSVGSAEALSPWLVPGKKRGPDWIDPGDIYLVPSTRGEAACLSAQEAMDRGAGVVASRVGLMPYLMPSNGAVRTFKRGDTSQAASSVMELTRLSSSAFVRACEANRQAIRERSTFWYDYTIDAITAN